MRGFHSEQTTTAVRIPIGEAWLHGDMGWPAKAQGLVVFAHGSGSGRHSPRNQFVAGVLQQHGFGTLLLDLLTADEESVDSRTAHVRFDIDLLARRLVTVVDWVRGRRETTSTAFGLFGASTGAGAALVAAAARPTDIVAVVSRGGRPDLAGLALASVVAPTLLIVGGLDETIIQMNRDAMSRMPGEVVLDIVPGATHLFEEPGTLEKVATLASAWFARHLR